MRSRIERWRQYFQARRGPSVEELQRAHDAEAARLAELDAEEVARSLARTGCWFPGDPRW